ncbi:MAG: hypothetical protein IKQ30_04040 [Bacteroidales bacterium]|nr:hypothetical protein [Bacteroidales bacterium]
MTAIQLKQEFFQEFSTIIGDENFWRDAIDALRRFVKSRNIANNESEEESSKPRKKKVKDMTQEEKKLFLSNLYAKSRSENPELYSMFDKMKLTAEDINDKDERTQYIMSK